MSGTMAIYKNNQDSNITAKKVQLVTQFILLLEPFLKQRSKKGCHKVTKSQEISKNQEKLRKINFIVQRF